MRRKERSPYDFYHPVYGGFLTKIWINRRWKKEIALYRQGYAYALVYLDRVVERVRGLSGYPHLCLQIMRIDITQPVPKEFTFDFQIQGTNNAISVTISGDGTKWKSVRTSIDSN